MADQPSIYRAIFSSSIPLNLSESGFHASKYRISKLPSNQTAEYLLLVEFPIHMDSDGGANPDAEIQLIQHALSTFASTDVKLVQSGIQSLDHKIKSQEPAHGYIVDLNIQNCADLSQVIDSIAHTRTDIATQICRAMRCVHIAIRFLREDPSLCSLLLVIAGECLSSQDSVIPFSDIPIEGNRAERYCRFIRTFASSEEALKVQPDDELATELLKTAYFAHRSAYVHGGKEVSAAVKIADAGGRAYLKHGDYDTERRSPGNVWLLIVTRSAILNYALNSVADSSGAHSFEEIACNMARIQIRASRDVAGGSAVNIFEMDVE